MELAGQLLVDAMGSFSPIAAQARRGRKPDSVVMLVGSCATGLPDDGSADLLYSFTPISRYLHVHACACLCRMGLLQGGLRACKQRKHHGVHGKHGRTSHLGAWRQAGWELRLSMRSDAPKTPFSWLLSWQGAGPAVLLGEVPRFRWPHHLHVCLLRPRARCDLLKLTSYPLHVTICCACMPLHSVAPSEVSSMQSSALAVRHETPVIALQGGPA